MLFAGCYEPREGCLDINSLNFGVDADRPCADCCIYPALRMSFQHRSVYADTSVNFQLLDSVYYDGAGNPYRVADFRFLLSGVRLVRPNGEAISLSNRIPVRVFGAGNAQEPDSITNDILLIRPALTARIDAGTLRANGAFRALRFIVGLSSANARVNPESLPPNHPMRPSASGMEWSRLEGYEFQRLRLLPGAMPEDTASVIVRIRRPEHTRTVELPIDVDIPEGYNVEFDIRINYSAWLRDISPATQTPETLIEHFIARTAQAFTVVGVRYVRS